MECHYQTVINKYKWMNKCVLFPNFMRMIKNAVKLPDIDGFKTIICFVYSANLHVSLASRPAHPSHVPKINHRQNPDKNNWKMFRSFWVNKRWILCLTKGSRHYFSIIYFGSDNRLEVPFMVLAMNGS